MIRDIKNAKYDIIQVKQTVKNRLWKDPDIIETLNNPLLDLGEDGSCSGALGVNIFDFIRIPDTQDEVRNFICFEAETERQSYTNDKMKMMNLIFFCISHQDDIKTESGIPRCDVLGYLVNDLIAWSESLVNGTQWKEFYNKTQILDMKWHVRIIKFQADTPSNISDHMLGNRYERVQRT